MAIATKDRMNVKSPSTSKRGSQESEMPPDASHLDKSDLDALGHVLGEQISKMADTITYRHDEALTDAVSKMSDQISNAIKEANNHADAALSAFAEQAAASMEGMASSSQSLSTKMQGMASSIEALSKKKKSDWVGLWGLHATIIALVSGTLYYTSQVYQDVQSRALDEDRAKLNQTLASEKAALEKTLSAYEHVQEGKLLVITTKMDEFAEKMNANTMELSAFRKEANATFLVMASEIKEMNSFMRYASWPIHGESKILGPVLYHDYADQTKEKPPQ